MTGKYVTHKINRKSGSGAPLLIPVYGTPTEASLPTELRQCSTDTVILLDPRGLRAESVQRAEARFFDFYRHAANAAQNSGADPLFLCPSALSAPSALTRAPRPFFARDLLLSQLTALLRVSATTRVAPILPYADSKEHFHALHGLLDTAMSALFAQNVVFDEFLPVGALPASFEILSEADPIFEEADFLLIDTDLPWYGSETALLTLLQNGISKALQAGHPTLLYGKKALSPALLPGLLDAGAVGLCLPTHLQEDVFRKVLHIFKDIT